MKLSLKRAQFHQLQKHDESKVPELMEQALIARERAITGVRACYSRATCSLGRLTKLFLVKDAIIKAALPSAQWQS